VPAEPHRRRRTTIDVREAPDVPPADDYGYGYGNDDPDAGFEL